jgi:hypothetical protein
MFWPRGGGGGIASDWSFFRWKSPFFWPVTEGERSRSKQHGMEISSFYGE